MPRLTALIGAHQHRWTPWLAEQLGGRVLLMLDPADTHLGPPARAVLSRGEEVLGWRFVGSTDVSRQPLMLVRAAVELLAKAKSDVIALLPPYRPNPVWRQTLQTLVSVLRPDELLAPDEDLPVEGWGMGLSRVALEPALPEVVRNAQHRARWIEVQEDAALHEIRLTDTTFLGSRLGTGERVLFPSEEALQGVLYAEMAAGTLYLVSRAELDEATIAMAIQVSHANRVHCVLEQDFDHVICCMVRANGEPYGIGMIERAEFKRDRLIVRSTAIPGLVAPTLMIGSHRVDGEGRTLGEIKPWSL